MPSDPITLIHALFQETVAAHGRFVERHAEAVSRAAAAIGGATTSGGCLIAFGNGGSAADAQHLVAELVGRFEVERRPLPAIALTPDSSVVTAIANDYGFQHVFSRQVDAIGRAGDIAFGISTSGRSPNVQEALALAKSRGLMTVALTGRDGGKMGADADIHLNVPETSTARIQEVHRTILHAICSLIDRHFQPTGTT
jgi:phosphoheptose isomerase